VRRYPSAWNRSGLDSALDSFADAEQEIPRLKDPLKHTDKSVEPDNEIPSRGIREHMIGSETEAA
jgi:hypothetical protein